MAKEVNIQINVKKEGAEKNLQTIGVGLKGIQEGAKAAGKSMFGLTKILKGTIVVKAFNAALDILKETFMSNQQVVDTLNTATTALKLVFNDFFNLLFGNVDNMSTFGQELYRNLQEPFVAALRSLQFFAKAMVNVLALQFPQAAANAAIGAEYFNQALGENNENIQLITDSLSDYTSGIIDNAKNIVELDKTYKIAQATNQGLIEKFDRQAEQQRQLRDDTRESVQSRIAANEELGRILDEQEKKMIENAEIGIAAAEAKLALDKNNVDAQVELINANNELAAIEARIDSQRSEQKTNQAALSKELIELDFSRAQGAQEAASITNNAEAELIDNEVQRLERLKAIEAEERLEIEETLKRKVASYKEDTQERINAQNELNKFVAESDAQQKKREKEIADAKVAAVSGALGSIANLVGQNSGFGKAIAITQAIIDTYAGATKALGQGGIFGFVGAASVIAAGLANVKTITSTKQPQPPSFAKGGGGASAAIPAAASAAPPAFNVVGASTESQLAQTIATAQQKPVRAYVVSTDMSSQQALDRKTANQATLGN